MRRKADSSRPGSLAPGIPGAVFCLLAAFAWTGCEKKNATPDWDAPGGTSVPAATAPAAIPPKPVATVPATDDDPETPPPEESAPVIRRKSPAPAASTDDTAPTTAGLRFITYNVENWLTMDRYVGGKSLKGAPKPDDEKKSVIDILARHQPDAIGLCEVGEAADLAEIREKLKAAGLDLPHSRYTGGADPTRHLGLLSRFPIVATAEPAETEYRLAGKTFGINRGILDATVSARGKSYRFVGVHLKSKRDTEQGDQEEMRLNEGRLLRRHLDSILKADGDARVIVYGDFNDTRATPPIKTITGKYNDPFYLTAIPAKDSRDEAWTHYWALHDIYSRFDFVMVTRGLRPDVDFRASRILDDADWNQASDHRPVMAIFR